MTRDSELHGSIYHKERLRHLKNVRQPIPAACPSKDLFQQFTFQRAQQLRGYPGLVDLSEKHRRAKKFQEPTFQKRRSDIPAGAFGWERNSLAVGVSSFRRQTTRWKQNQLCRFAYTAPLENRYLDGRLVRLDRFGLRDHERRAHAAAVQVFGWLRRSEVCDIAGVHVLIDSRPK